jgi:hypothetical protein
MSVFRVYEPDECGPDGYPLAWHSIDGGLGVKHLVRAAAGNRCVRCGHPYTPGAGEWSPCDARCTHAGPTRSRGVVVDDDRTPIQRYGRLGDHLVGAPEARWRILTVHHLRLGDEHKRDLRWWNLAALCQRCHLQIQGKVQMERIWPWPHSDWFKPYAAGWYAWSYLGENLTREQTEARLDELLALELAA